MSRTSSDEIKDGAVFNGYDYALQVWVVAGVVQTCHHPVGMGEDCCNARKLAGREIVRIAGHDKRNEPAADCPACGSRAPRRLDNSCADCRCSAATREALNAAKPRNPDMARCSGCEKEIEPQGADHEPICDACLDSEIE